MDDWEDDFGTGPSHQGGAADPLVDTEYARIEQRYTDVSRERARDEEGVGEWMQRTKRGDDKDKDENNDKTNDILAGYREGITDGKLATLQAGFDASFASSVPASRRLGQLRGRAHALLAILTTAPAPAPAPRRSPASSSPPPPAPSSSFDSPLITTARALVADLARVRRADVLPIDHERMEHEREAHGEYELDPTESRAMEGLEDALGRLGGKQEQTQACREGALLDVLEERVRALEGAAGIA